MLELTLLLHCLLLNLWLAARQIFDQDFGEWGVVDQVTDVKI